MNPPTGSHLLNGAGLQNLQLQQQQLQQLLQNGLNTQQLAQLLAIQQQPQPQLNGFGASINTSMGSQHQQLVPHSTAAFQSTPQFVLTSHAQPPVPQPQVQTQSAPMPSLNWPTCTAFPLAKVPYFDVNSYKTVNLDVSPSCDPNGLDLPLGDMNTLRFFFNLGVQQSKVLMLASKNNQHSINADMQVQHMHQQQQQQHNLVDQLALNNSHLLRQMAAAQQQAVQQAAAQQATQNHVSQTPVLQSLTHQQQQLAQQNQILLATARAHGLTERHLAQFGIQTPEIVQLAAQTQQLPQQPPAMTTLPTSVSVATVTPAMTRATPTAREFSSAKSSVGPDQAPDANALVLHQALLSISNKQPNVNLHEARIQQLLGQQVHNQPIPIHSSVDPMLKAVAAAAEVLKPVAVGGGSGDAAVSPRPPIPVDPSPPKALIEATRNQQAQTSPPTSLPTSTAEKPKIEPIIGAHRPASARESTAHSILNGLPGKTSAPPNIAQEEPASIHLFQVSEKNFTEAFTKTAQAANPIGIARQDGTQPSGSSEVSSTVPSTSADKKEDDDNKPALAPILMMSFLNSCMTNLKDSNGQPVGGQLDAKHLQVDFSARPVDKIFQQARQQQAANNIREMSPLKRKPSPPTTTPQPEIITVSDTSPPSYEKSSSPVVKVDDDRSDSGSEAGGKRLRIATDEE